MVHGRESAVKTAYVTEQAAFQEKRSKVVGKVGQRRDREADKVDLC